MKMSKSKTATVELDNADISEAMIEYVQRRHPSLKKAIKPTVQFETQPAPAKVTFTIGDTSDTGGMDASNPHDA